MLRMSLIDTALNRLSAHFGPRLVVRPPAYADELAELEHVVGHLPRELTIFLSTCNGLRIGTDTFEPGLRLWSVREMISYFFASPGPDVPEGFVPFSGDPTGEREWLIFGHGSAENAVMRWDPWVPGAELIASGFGNYLDGWSHYVTLWFDSHGTLIQTTGDKPRFDGEFMKAHDNRIGSLTQDDRIREWLREIDRAIACGDDFE